MDWASLDGMFRLRDEVFISSLAQDVLSQGGLERDKFDDMDPVYLIARANERRVDGCTITTYNWTMLSDVFPQLLQGEDAPRDAFTWELSRFTANADRNNPQAGIGDISLGLMRTAVEYAENHRITRYVAVTSAAMERMLRGIGMPTRRLGEGKAIRIGKVLTVACYIPIDGRTRAALAMESPLRFPKPIRTSNEGYFLNEYISSRHFKTYGRNRDESSPAFTE